MHEVQRYDTVELRKPQRFANGWLRADAYLTRPGVFEYLEGDGRIRRELRLPEEVFDAASMETLQLVPVTLRHPRDDDGQRVLLDASNTKRYAVGHAGEQVSRDGDRVRNALMITDADAVTMAESGGARQISCGYRCKTEETPGVTKGVEGIPDGLPYDAIQRAIRYNHVALEPIGRAGFDIGIRLDAGDAIMVVKPNQDSQPDGVPAMAKIRLDGVDFDAPEQLVQAITANQHKHQLETEGLRAEIKTRTDALGAKDTELAVATKKVETEAARADAADSAAKQAKAELVEAQKPERVAEAVKARVSLERDASAVLGSDAKFDGLDDAAIKRAVIEKTFPDTKERLDGKSADYVQALYEQAISKAGKDAETDTDRARVENALGKPAPGVTRTDAAAVAREASKKQSEAWKQPLAATKGA